MLSEEEKKAVSNLNFIVVTDIYDNEVRINKTEIVNEYNHSVGIVLNLITKLQKENEYWKNGFERELEANRENTCELLKQDLMIKEKDKQIHLMAEYIDEIDVSEVICGEKIICDENCKDCIKQYFENKAKKGE